MNHNTKKTEISEQADDDLRTLSYHAEEEADEVAFGAADRLRAKVTEDAKEIEELLAEQSRLHVALNGQKKGKARRVRERLRLKKMEYVAGHRRKSFKQMKLTIQRLQDDKLALTTNLRAECVSKFELLEMEQKDRHKQVNDVRIALDEMTLCVLQYRLRDVNTEIASSKISMEDVTMAFAMRAGILLEIKQLRKRGIEV